MKRVQAVPREGRIVHGTHIHLGDWSAHHRRRRHHRLQVAIVIAWSLLLLFLGGLTTWAIMAH